jgi:hypothetical protein
MMRMRAGAALLAVVCVVWASVPWRGSGIAPTIAIFAALAAALSALRLLVGWLPRPENEFLVSAPMRAWIWFHGVLRGLPWEEGVVVLVVWLEALHRSGPWHVAVLGLLLIAYLLAAHLAESGSPVRSLRPQGRVLLLGVLLLAAGAAVGIVPAATGPGGALLRVVAALAAVLAAALILPASW